MTEIYFLGLSPSSTMSTIRDKGEGRDAVSVTTFGDILHFRQQFKAGILPKTPTFLGIFCKGVKIIHFSSEFIFGQLFIDIWRFLSGHTGRCTRVGGGARAGVLKDKQSWDYAGQYHRCGGDSSADVVKYVLKSVANLINHIAR